MRLYRISQIAISIVYLSCLLLFSCGSPPQEFPEGNIDVDSEIYIVPIDAFLFSVGLEFQTDLDSSNVSGILKRFKDSNFELSDNTSIEKRDDGWLIWDESNRRKYFVKKEDNELNIYKYVDEQYLYPLIPKLEKRFTTKVHLALDKRISISDDTYDYKASQYVAMYVLTDLIKKVSVPGNAKILGVANVDLYVPESDLPFVFGQAHVGKSGKAAIISMLRMDPFSYKGGKPDDTLLAQRMVKEAVHELGHVFKLRNCSEPECVMYLPRNLKELDKKSDSFCLSDQKAFRALKHPKEATQNRKHERGQ